MNDDKDTGNKLKKRMEAEFDSLAAEFDESTVLQILLNNYNRDNKTEKNEKKKGAQSNLALF